MRVNSIIRDKKIFNERRIMENKIFAFGNDVEFPFFAGWKADIMV